MCYHPEDMTRHITGTEFWLPEVRYRNFGTGARAVSMTAVLTTLAVHVDSDDQTSIPIDRMSLFSKLSERTTRSILTELESMGLITRTRTRHGGKLNIYTTKLNREAFAQHPYIEAPTEPDETKPEPATQETVEETVLFEMDPQPEPKQRTTKQYPEDFEEFWQKYPRNKKGNRDNKTGAGKAWNRLTDEQKQFALKEVGPYFVEQDMTGFAAHAQTWLNRIRNDWGEETTVDPEVLKNKQAASNPDPRIANQTVDKRNPQHYTPPPRRTIQDIEPHLAMYDVPLDIWERWCKAYKTDILDVNQIPECAERWHKSKLKQQRNREANTQT